METADAVIIGGGCVGTSALYHLASLGCTNVMLLEAETLGAGSTSKAAGGIRLQHSDEVNTRLALRSLDEFVRFEEMTEVPIDFKQVGYLILQDNDADVAAFRTASVAQRKLGVPTEQLDVGAIREMVPQIVVDDLRGATFCALEGYASPESVVQGYANAARRLGAVVRLGRRVTEIRVEGDAVARVVTDRGDIATPAVILAAGVHSGALTRPLGYELPVHPEIRSIYFSSSSAGLADAAPLVVDFSTGFYFHREGGGLIFAGRENAVEDLSEPALKRLPAIADLSIESSWSGAYDMSPDHNAMIGRATVAGLYYATGFSGHGFMQSPAVGEHLAQLVLGMPTTLDLSSLSARRFIESGHRTEQFVI